MADLTFETDRRLRNAAYWAAQAPRLAWCWALYAVAARVAPPADTNGIEPPAPGVKAVREDLLALIDRDRAQIRDGVYRAADLGPPRGGRGPFAAARDFLRDARDVKRRREADKGGQEVFAERDAAAGGDYPRYYLQNFHYQSDGWLSRDSAERYDLQVEVLFGGGADAMRRQALPPVRAELARRAAAGAAPRDMAIVDLACGAGGFLRELKANFPAASVVGLDLSPDYLSVAAERLADWRRGVDFVQAPAEATPFADSSFDAATSIYLFHELPPKIRAAVAREAARVLKPGGVFVFVDTILEGDHPPFDGLLARFPVQFHEPYYADYVRSDVEGLFEAAGFVVERVERAFLSRVMTLRKA